MCDVVELLEYWGDEPPAHVTLALRYLGQSKRSKAQPTQAEARSQMAEMAVLPGLASGAPLPPRLREMVQKAEALKKSHKGI